MRIEHLNLPWEVAPLSGKYYGTIILNADGDEVMKLWNHGWDYDDISKPSGRQLESWGNPSEEELRELMCDSHWEGNDDYECAQYVVKVMNASATASGEQK